VKTKFTFLARAGKKFIPVQIQRGTPIAPEGATTYYARFTEDGKRQWKPLGSDITQAFTAFRNLELRREYKKRDMPMPDLLAPTVTGLPARIAEYSDEIKANKRPKTWQAYTNSTRYFAASCKRTSVNDVTREDLLAFKTYLRGQELSGRSVYNNFLNVMVFLKWCGVKTAIKATDWPECPEREPEEYTDEQIMQLLNAAEPEERLLLNCFLCSGLRSGEMQHLVYGDIDFKHSVWTVRPKGDWSAKNIQSQRDVPIPEWLIKKLQERMAKGRALNDLVFFNSEGGPDAHLLRVVKGVAKRAKLTGIRVDDHKFRSTAITRWLREGNSVHDVMRWVGHKDLNTILRYAAKVNVRKAETHKKAAGAFAQFAGVGD
jgi:integrase